MDNFLNYVNPHVTGVDELIGLCLVSSSHMHSAHFETPSYSQHKVYEDFYESMPELIDEFTEIYLGSGHKYVKTFPKDDLTPEEILNKIINLANSVHGTVCSSGQSALDDILTLCKKTKYLLSLK